MHRLVLAVSSLVVAVTEVALFAAPPAHVKLQATAAPEFPSLMLGEPGFVRFVVANEGPRDLRAMVGGDYRNRLGRPESFTVTVLDPNGEPVPQPDAGIGMGGLTHSKPLPKGGNCVFELFLPNWATFARPGRYSIAISRKLTVVPDDGSDPFAAAGTTVDVSATTTLEIVPDDPVRMQQRIDEVGRTMLDRTDDRCERAEKQLAAFDDVRVVPWFVKLSKLPHQSPRGTACDPLGKYDDTDAIDALVALARTTAADVRNGSTTLALAVGSADNVRHSAAVALAASPHPSALAELWKLEHDAYYGVRMTVLHAAAAHDTAEAQRIVLDMTIDPNDDVRNEAKRYANR